MAQSLSIAILQTQSVDDVQINQRTILAAMKAIPGDKKLDLICLPENALYMRVVEGEAIQGFDLNDSVFDLFKAFAKERKLVLHLGSVPLKIGTKMANASLLVLPSGKLQAEYNKIHLFDIQLEGQKSIRESDVFQHGESPSVFEVEGWKIGQSICYDLRFAELYSRYAKVGVDLILVPAAFLVPTGQAHWQVLLRARAIESQCYVIAAAQAGEHKSVRSAASRHTYGHSLVVGPWGELIAEGNANKPQTIYVQLQRSEIEKVRRQIPMKDHRRL
jgi:predicted amidohydrolase